jgi:curved DNA-binding protein CbpA
MSNDEFIDYYDLLQISPQAELETVQRVYQMLAARFDPGNPRSGDPERFQRLQQAYQVLSNRTARAAYDAEYRSRQMRPITLFENREFASGIDGEANRRMGVLCLLYNRRRTNPEYAGFSILELEAVMFCPREHLMFTLWYLKDAELIVQDEKSDFVITSRGVDRVEQNLSAYESLQQLLRAAEAGKTERSTGASEPGAASRGA